MKQRYIKGLSNGPPLTGQTMPWYPGWECGHCVYNLKTRFDYEYSHTIPVAVCSSLKFRQAKQTKKTMYSNISATVQPYRQSDCVGFRSKFTVSDGQAPIDRG